MGRHRLTNDQWGLDSCCFVCEARNDAGLRLEVYALDDRPVVETEFELGAAYSGAPAVIHGGISLAILDEIQAWAVIAHGRQWGATVETKASFHQPVWIDTAYRAEAELMGRADDRFTTVGRIVDRDGQTCVEAETVFQALGEATAEAWAGGQPAPTL